jgi:uncharacterized protein YqhQ
LIESLVLGVKALNYSTEISVSAKPNTSLVDKPVASADRVGRVDQTDPPQPAPFESNAPSIPQGSVQPSVNESSEKGLHPLALFFSVAMGIGLGLVLFVALPHVLSIWFGAMGGFDESTLPFHILDGLLKFAIFLAYVWLIGLIPDIARVYAYHGAEHQAIHVYEAGLPLEPLEAKQFPTWHPRCGTAFIFLVLAASILFFAIIFPLLAPFSELARFPRALAGVGLKLAFTPFLAVVAYEITKMAGKPDSGRLWQAMVWPGLILQRLTTRKPDDSMLEVAFKSLEAVIPGKN